ncbi:hypothetical protein [Cupriavidus metallidurans]|uniref:hypothetical protein n=1 Tax=Cupriavidus metallidurans TaxID=119219 RepID=UPI001CCF9E14|nr:hypothetical protein [Cupriavidus metallidurans]UBM12764.1 hypothetical protein LAI70_27820 [Cupriavidus metallidurans]
MKKLRITEPGWETYTGNYGGIEFVDGVSVNLVSPFDASRLAALIRIEDSDGKNPSVSQLIVDSRSFEADQEMVSSMDTGVKRIEGTISRDTGYTRDQLGEIADKGGIKAIRVIAEPLGIRGTKVTDIIDKIIAGQGGEPTPEPAADDGVVNADVDTDDTATGAEAADAGAGQASEV